MTHRYTKGNDEWKVPHGNKKRHHECSGCATLKEQLDVAIERANNAESKLEDTIVREDNLNELIEANKADMKIDAGRLERYDQLKIRHNDLVDEFRQLKELKGQTAVHVKKLDKQTETIAPEKQDVGAMTSLTDDESSDEDEVRGIPMRFDGDSPDSPTKDSPKRPVTAKKEVATQTHRVELQKRRKKRGRKVVPLCFNCNRYGHIAKNCKSKKRCSQCGRTDHIKAACTRKIEQGPSCINCRGDHLASSHKCPKYKTQVRKVRTQRPAPRQESPSWGPQYGNHNEGMGNGFWTPWGFFPFMQNAFVKAQGPCKGTPPYKRW